MNQRIKNVKCYKKKLLFHVIHMATASRKISTVSAHSSLHTRKGVWSAGKNQATPSNAIIFCIILSEREFPKVLGQNITFKDLLIIGT